MIEVLEKNPVLKSLKISNVNFNHPPIMEHMVNHLTANITLVEFDVSFCQIFASDLVKLLEVFSMGAEARQIQFLNLSYININTEPPMRFPSENSPPGKKKIIELTTNEKFITYLCNFLQNRGNLKHLDLSGMNLRDQIRPLIDSIKKN